jgi:flavin reductase (DIM6/NTAB) family NADH-FMN oxidoreductase RutF
MKKYVEIPMGVEIRLINHGPVVWVCSKGKDGKYDLAPVAWQCPVSMDPPMILIGVGMENLTYQNIQEKGEFIVALPHRSQAELVRQTGSISGSEIDKYKEMSIASFAGKKVDAKIPQDCIGYLECKVARIVEMEGVGLVMADVLAGFVDKDAFDRRLLVEKEAGKTIHHLGDRIFAVPGDKVI